jgi:hypothetical protein
MAPNLGRLAAQRVIAEAHLPNPILKTNDEFLNRHRNAFPDRVEFLFIRDSPADCCASRGIGRANGASVTTESRALTKYESVQTPQRIVRTLVCISRPGAVSQQIHRLPSQATAATARA